MIIYALADPRDGAIRYIGQTEKPSTRLQQHRNPTPKSKAPVAWWVRKLKALGLRPFMLPLFSIEHIEDADEAERVWISTFRQLGFRLLNYDNGGQDGRRGIKGRKHTEEWKAAMRGRVPWNKGKKMPVAAIAAMSAAARGRKQLPAHIEARRLGMLGHIVSTETRAKISASHLGMSPTTEARAKISAALIGRRPSDETRAKLRASQTARRAREAAQP